MIVPFNRASNVGDANDSAVMRYSAYKSSELMLNIHLCSSQAGPLL